MSEVKSTKEKETDKPKSSFNEKKPTERSYFPTSNVFTYSKLVEMIDFFATTGNVPLTKEQMIDKLKDVGNLENVLDRVVNFCWKNMIIFTFIKSEKKYSLKKEVYDSLKNQKKTTDDTIKDEVLTCKGYLILTKYVKDENLDDRFFVEHFIDYLKKSKIGFNEIGLITWFNFLKTLNLVGYNIQTKQVTLSNVQEAQKEATEEILPLQQQIVKQTQFQKMQDTNDFIISISGPGLNFSFKIEAKKDLDDIKSILQIVERKIKSESVENKE